MVRLTFMTGKKADEPPESLVVFASRIQSEWAMWKAERRAYYGAADLILGGGVALDLADASIRLMSAAAAVAAEPPTPSLKLGDLKRAAEESVATTSRLTLALNAVHTTGETLQGLQVSRLRQLQVPWQKVGSALMMTAQSAHQKARDKRWITNSQDQDS
jgi:hypothetical protein